MNFAFQKLAKPTPERLAALVAASPRAIWLDSAMPEHRRGRYSVLTLEPVARIRVRATGAELIQGDARQSLADPFAYLDDWLRKIRVVSGFLGGFSGGVMGWLDYEGEAEFHLVDTAMLIDHASEPAWVFSLGLQDDLLSFSRELARERSDRMLQSIAAERELDAAPNQIEHWTSNFSQEEYEERVRAIQEALRAGDCYQVNLAQRFVAKGGWNPARLYLALREAMPAPQAAWVNGGEYHFLSASPETLLRIVAGRIDSYPIKGTRRRGAVPDADAKLAADLLLSEKDAAELLMIVDLMRNDLGRICRYGTVEVPELKALESFRQVHHLVAQVRGELRPDVGAMQALQALSPGGSITGAPKLKAMEMIRRLEATPRGIYTGSIGYADFSGRSSWNIAIRTAALAGSFLEYGAGGGIVVDSDPVAEYAETLDKARGFFEALGIAI